MSTISNHISVELTFSQEQFVLLDQEARTRQLVVSETIQLAVNEWLEKQTRLAHGRTQMRVLAQGIAGGQSPHDKARNHDAYLYQRPNP